MEREKTSNDGAIESAEQEQPLILSRRRSLGSGNSDHSLFDFEIDATDRDNPVPSASTSLFATKRQPARHKTPIWLTIVLLFVIAVAPILVASNRPVYWMVWAAIIFATLAVYALRLARRGERFPVPLKAMPLISASAVLFVGYAIIQTVPLSQLPGQSVLSGRIGLPESSISIVPQATFLAALRWSTYAAFFFLCLQVSKSRSLSRRLAYGVFVIVGLHAIYGLVSFRFLGPEAYLGPDDGYTDVVTGTFINRNSFATFAGMGLIVGLSLLLQDALRSEPKNRGIAAFLTVEGLRSAVWWLLLIMIMAALISTASRMGLGATGIGILVVFAILVRKNRQSNIFVARLAVAALVVLAAASLYLFGEALVERAIYLEADGQTRLDVYAQVADLIRMRPYLGFGLDNFEIAYQQVHRPPVSPDLLWDRAHSTYLTLWSEMGLIFGSLPVLIVFLLLFRFLFVDLRHSRDIVLSTAALGVIAQTGFHSLVDFSLEMPANVFLLLFILSLAAGRRFRARDPSTGS